MKYFAHCRNKQEAKKTFRELAKKYHPDITGGTEEANAIMTAIIAEYETILKTLPSDNTQADNTNHDESEEAYNTRITQEMKDIIDNISHLPINIEIIGTWIWVSGDTYKYKSYLTAYNFTWCPKKKMYSWHGGPKHKRYGKTKDIEDIRATYGSQKVYNKERYSIA